MNDAYFLLPAFGSLLIKYAAITGICSLRLAVVAIMFPPITEMELSGTARNGLIALIGGYIAYGQPIKIIEGLDITILAALVAKEVLIGLLLGFAASSVFWVAESAGIYIDNLTGYNNVQVVNPQNEQQATPTSTLLKQISIVSFWSFGGLTFLLSALYESYSWWPVSSPGIIEENIIFSFILTQSDSLMQATAKLAVPVVFLLLLVDIAFGFIGKSSQKLELNALAQPIKGALAVLMLALLAGLFVEQAQRQLALVDLGIQFKRLMGR